MQKQIVILGAGFGGLRVATFLAKKRQPVILIDRNAYHTYTPMLYEIAVTPKETANYCDLKSIVTFPIKDLIKGLSITFINEGVKQLDLINGDIHLETQQIHFDCLVLALGSETNYFNIPGLEENSLSFKSFMDSLHIREKIIDLPLGAKPNLIIGGGGPTGIELAGEIQLSGLANTTIIQSPPDILPGFNTKLVSKASKRLTELGVKFVFDTITEVKDKHVFLKTREPLSFDFLIWTGGTKTNFLMNPLPLKKEVGGRINVVEKMSCLPKTPDLKLAGDIYAIGDSVCFYDPKTNKPIPGLASIAIDQGTIAAKNILGKKATYKIKVAPYILPIGGKYAVFQIGSLIVDGYLAWILKGLVELKYLLHIMPYQPAFKIWFKGLKIFLENDRLG